MSYCRICPALCGILVDVDIATGRALKVRGDPDHPLSAGYTCPKGRALPEEHAAPDRLRQSLRRGSDGIEPVSSVTALDEVASRLIGIIDRHGPRSVGLFVGTRGYEIVPLSAATAWLTGIGSPSLYSTYTIDQPGKDLARAMHGSWSSGFHPASSSDVVMFVGNNPLVSQTSSYISFPTTNTRTELRRMKEAGLRMIVIDPRRTETAAWADIHLQPTPGQDAAVLAGMIRWILVTESFDAEFVARYATGLEGLRSAVDPFTPDHVERVTTVPEGDLRAAAELFARGPRGAAVGGTGLNMAPHSVLNEYLLLCLNTLCGRYVRAGEQVANPGTLTQGRTPRAEARGPRVIWGRGEAQPRVRGLSTLYDQMPASALADEILTPGEGQIRALVVSGGNPAVALPDQHRVLEALSNLELLVCLDVRETATTALADVVIGCKLSLEKSDTTLAHDLRFARPFAQATPAVTTAPGDLLEEWEVFQGLAERMGTPWDLGGRIGMPIPVDVADGGAERPTSGDEIWDRLCASGRLSLDEVRAHPHGVIADSPPVIVEQGRPPASDADRLQLAEPSLMAELSASRSEAQDPAFDRLLISRRMWEYYNSWGQDVPSVRRRWGANPAFLHPTDMDELGVDDGARVVVTSRRGELTAIARPDADLPRGVVSMAHCWGATTAGRDVADTGSCTNALIDASTDLDQIVGMARQSAIPVRVRPAEPIVK